jgi:PAS domain S-box-containing protein
MTAWNTAVATGEPFEVKFRIRHHRGDYHWFDTRATALRDAAGRIIKWFGMNMDITDRRHQDRAGEGAEETPPGNEGGPP